MLPGVAKNLVNRSMPFEEGAGWVPPPKHQALSRDGAGFRACCSMWFAGSLHEQPTANEFFARGCFCAWQHATYCLESDNQFQRTAWHRETDDEFAREKGIPWTSWRVVLTASPSLAKMVPKLTHAFFNRLSAHRGV